MSNHEIERVFLLEGMPEIPSDCHATMERWDIDQGYFDTSDPENPDPAHPEGRIRSVRHADGSTTYCHTVKRGLGLVREEREIELTREQFDELWPQTEGRRIRKTRFRVTVGEQLWELDQFLDFELVLAEAELDTTEASLPIPEWLAQRIIREVTEEPAFRNFELARTSGKIPGS